MGIPTPTPSSVDRYKQEAQELMKRQDLLLAQLHGLEAELQEHRIGMDEPLIDSQGYPRSDIDVAAVRQIRNNVYRLRNDHKQVMGEIETVLHQLHQATKLEKEQQATPMEDVQQSSTATSSIQPSPESSTSFPPSSASTSGLQPFAKVNAVSPESPASEAGLLRNDLILQFGNVQSTSSQPLQSLASVVQSHMNQALEIKVLRDQQQVTLSLTPRNGWGGRGALGCHILPIL